jgi:flagellar motor switch protein FliN
MNEENFNDPLADFDPIMDNAFSVNESNTDPTQEETPEAPVKKETPAASIKKETPAASVKKETPAAPVKKETPAASVKKETPETPVQEELPTEPSDPDNLFGDDDTAFDIDESLFEDPKSTSGIEVSKVSFNDTPISIPSNEIYDKNLFKNIKVDVSIELGRSSINLKKLYELKSGSIIELSRLVGEPLDLVIKDQVIARGEVVAVNNNYGIRITNIESLAELP